MAIAPPNNSPPLSPSGKLIHGNCRMRVTKQSHVLTHYSPTPLSLPAEGTLRDFSYYKTQESKLKHYSPTPLSLPAEGIIRDFPYSLYKVNFQVTLLKITFANNNRENTNEY